jgi:hypothetical protein
MEAMGCTEISVRNYRDSLRKIPQERTYQELRTFYKYFYFWIVTGLDFGSCRFCYRDN